MSLGSPLRCNAPGARLRSAARTRRTAFRVGGRRWPGIGPDAARDSAGASRKAPMSSDKPALPDQPVSQDAADPNLPTKWWTLSDEHRHQLERCREDFRNGLGDGKRMEAAVVTGLMMHQVPWNQILENDLPRQKLGNASIFVEDRSPIGYTPGGLDVAVCLYGVGLTCADFSLFSHYAVNVMYWLREAKFPGLTYDWNGVCVCFSPSGSPSSWSSQSITTSLGQHTQSPMTSTACDSGALNWNPPEIHDGLCVSQKEANRIAGG